MRVRGRARNAVMGDYTNFMGYDLCGKYHYYRTSASLERASAQTAGSMSIASARARCARKSGERLCTEQQLAAPDSKTTIVSQNSNAQIHCHCQVSIHSFSRAQAKLTRQLPVLSVSAHSPSYLNSLLLKTTHLSYRLSAHADISSWRPNPNSM